MDLSERVLGSTVATALAKRHATVILRLGRDKFFRADFAKVECYNFPAAANVSKALDAAKLTITDTRDLFDRISPKTIAALPHMGVISLVAIGAAFEAKRIGGERPLLAWFKRHVESGEMTTYGTMRQHAVVAHRQEAAVVKQRTAPRLVKRPRVVHEGALYATA